MIVYFNGQFMPKDEVRISPDDRGFLFADGVYEAIVSYSGRPFRIDEHLRRLERSLRELRMEGFDARDLKDVVERLIQANDLGAGEALTYIEVTRGAAPRGHVFPEPGISPTVYASATPFAAPRENCARGVKAILVPDVRWARCDVKSIALLPNVLASQRAKEQGAEEALFVRDGAITEGTHTNFCAVFDGRLLTYPKSNHILPGVTREVVLELCGELGIPCTEEPVLESRLREADELMIVGTTSEIMPLVRVDDWQVGSGRPGPVTRRLEEAFEALVH